MSSPAPASASRADLLGAIARIGAVVLAVLLSFSALDSLQVAITRCTAAAAVALIVALALGTAGHLALGLSARIGERARRHLAAHGHGALAAATAYLVLRPWNFYSDRHHSALVVPVLTWLGVVSLRLGVRVLGQHAYVSGTTLAALLLVACDAVVLPGLYRTFHSAPAGTRPNATAAHADPARGRRAARAGVA